MPDCSDEESEVAIEGSAQSNEQRIESTRN